MRRHRVALVTGASRGIGEAITWMLAAHGWHVFAAGRDAERLEALRSTRVTPVSLDLRDPASIDAAVELVLEQGGRIDALVNNAGYSASGALADVDLDRVRDQFDVNVFGPLRLTQRVVPVMRAQGSGRIVSLGTVMGRTAFPLLGLYSSSKAAMEMFSEGLRLELRAFGIRTIVVIPGTVDTDFDQTALDMLRAAMPDETSPYHGPMTKLDRMIEKSAGHGVSPVDVAEKVAHALTTRWPKALYTMNKDARLMLWLVARLPPVVRDRIMRMPLKL